MVATSNNWHSRSCVGATLSTTMLQLRSNACIKAYKRSAAVVTRIFLIFIACNICLNGFYSMRYFFKIKWNCLSTGAFNFFFVLWKFSRSIAKFSCVLVLSAWIVFVATYIHIYLYTCTLRHIQYKKLRRIFIWFFFTTLLFFFVNYSATNWNIWSQPCWSQRSRSQSLCSMP